MLEHCTISHRLVKNVTITDKKGKSRSNKNRERYCDGGAIASCAEGVCLLSEISRILRLSLYALFGAVLPVFPAARDQNSNVFAWIYNRKAKCLHLMYVARRRALDVQHVRRSV